MICQDGAGHGPEQHRLASARRSGDQATLSHAEGRDQIHRAGTDGRRGLGLKEYTPVWKQRGQLVEIERGLPVGDGNSFDLDQLPGNESSLAIAGEAHLGANLQARAQACSAVPYREAQRDRPGRGAS